MTSVLWTARLALAVIPALLLAACGGSREEAPASTMTPLPPTAVLTDEERIAAGGMNFSVFCVSCHGADARGIPGTGANLMESQFFGEKSEQELVEFVIEGRPADHPDNTTGLPMLPRAGFPNLSDEQIAQIIAYLLHQRNLDQD